MQFVLVIRLQRHQNDPSATQHHAHERKPSSGASGRPGSQDAAPGVKLIGNLEPCRIPRCHHCGTLLVTPACGLLRAVRGIG